MKHVKCFTPQSLILAAKNWIFPNEKMQTPKRQTHYTYTDGPMVYLGQQIVKSMEDAGYPAKIHCSWRSPEEQQLVFNKGRSKARPWQSPHQFFEAVDIVHPSLYWAVSPSYWETLAACVELIALKYDVDLVHGHHWKFTDSAHIELKDWRTQRLVNECRYDAEITQWLVDCARMSPKLPAKPKRTRPNSEELAARFRSVLPKVKMP